MGEKITTLTLQEEALIVLDELAAKLGPSLEGENKIQSYNEAQIIATGLLPGYCQAVNLIQGEIPGLANTSLGELLQDHNLLEPFMLSWQAYQLAFQLPDDPLPQLTPEQKGEIKEKAFSLLSLSILSSAEIELEPSQVSELETTEAKLRTCLREHFGPTQPIGALIEPRP